MDDSSATKGVGLMAVGWTLISLAIIATATRLYSRIIVTRSAGSDDFFIFLAVALNILGQVGDTIAFRHGLGRHAQYLSPQQVSTVTKWDFIDLTKSFLCFFALRSSVMLFTLRLLPFTKRWPRRVIECSFFLNIIITIIAVVSYGIKCVPFTAIYKPVPGAWCERQNILVTTQQVNGVLGCIIDIVTALIPAFPLWNLKIKRQTKIFLNIIFSLGLMTSALSIGRAATTNVGELQTDFTWRILPPLFFTNVEEKLGIVLACCPSLRQFFIYYRRAGTVLPSKARQPPNADFVSWRQRVKLRDIFWYRALPTNASGSRGQMYIPPEAIRKGAATGAHDVENSPLDRYSTKLKSALSVRSASRKLSTMGTAGKPPPLTKSRTFETLHSQGSSPDELHPGKSKDYEAYGWPPTVDSERKRIASSYKTWGLRLGARGVSSASSEDQHRHTFLRTESGGSFERLGPYHKASSPPKDEGGTSEESCGHRPDSISTLQSASTPAEWSPSGFSTTANLSTEEGACTRAVLGTESPPAIVSHQPVTASIRTPRLVYIPPQVHGNATRASRQDRARRGTR